MFLASVKHFVIFILKCAIQSHLTADIIKNKKLTHVITNSNSFLSLATIFLTFKKKKAYHICPCQSTGLLPCFFCVYVCVCPTWANIRPEGFPVPWVRQIDHHIFSSLEPGKECVTGAELLGIVKCWRFTTRRALCRSLEHHRGSYVVGNG